MNTTPTSKGSISRWKVVVLFLMVFVTGTFAGSIATRFYIKNKLKGIIHGNFERRRSRVVKMLTRRLNLSPEQEVRINRIISDSEKRLMVLRDRHLEEMAKIFKETTQKIEVELTPAQKAQFEKMCHRMESRWMRARMRRHHQGTPRPGHFRRDHPPRHWRE
jgi:RNase P subunit RPR2